MFSQSADGSGTCFVQLCCLCIVYPAFGQWDTGPSGHSILQRAESWHFWIEGSVAPDYPYSLCEAVLCAALSLSWSWLLPLLGLVQCWCGLQGCTLSVTLSHSCRA